MESPLEKIAKDLKISLETIKDSFGMRYSVLARQQGKVKHLECTDFPDQHLTLYKELSDLSHFMVIDTQEGTIKCATCGHVSSSPNAIQNHYCEKCKVFLNE